MAPSFDSVWLEIAVAGLVTSAVANSLFSSAEAPKACEPTLARGDRTAILRGTCGASESGSASVAIDATRREVVVVRRFLGIPYARARVPLEIVSGFAIDEERTGRGVDRYVVASTPAGLVRLAGGERAEAAAEALARATAARGAR